MSEPLKTYLSKNDPYSLKKLTLQTLNKYKGIKKEVGTGATGWQVIEITDPETCVRQFEPEYIIGSLLLSEKKNAIFRLKMVKPAFAILGYGCHCCKSRRRTKFTCCARCGAVAPRVLGPTHQPLP